jgi:hypothetical protein
VGVSFPLSGCSVPVCRVLLAQTADSVGLLSASTITLADERTKPEGSKSPSADEQIVLRKHERAARKSEGGLDGSKAVRISRSSRAIHLLSTHAQSANRVYRGDLPPSSSSLRGS